MIKLMIISSLVLLISITSSKVLYKFGVPILLIFIGLGMIFGSDGIAVSYTHLDVYKRQEIGWLKNNFVELTEKLDEEKKNQNRIIASISHDIKTPLTSIDVYKRQELYLVDVVVGHI